YVLIVKATDDEGNESTLELLVTVSDVDEDAPVFTSASSTNYAENGEGVVYIAVATDAGTIAYTLADTNDAEFFDIDVSTGELSFKLSPDFETPLDGNEDNTYLINLIATDEEENSSIQLVAINVTNKTSCKNDSSEEPTIVLSTNTTNVTCNGEADGSIDLIVTGGSGPFTYTWSSGQVSKDISGLTAGGYSVLVTDNNGCHASLTVTVLEPQALELSTTVEDITCYGAADGSIDLQVSGGVAPYLYSWNSGSTSEDLSGLTAGVYEVTVEDYYGCIAVTSVTITEPTSLSVSSNHTEVSNASASDGSIDLTVTGGTAPYTYAWSNGKVTQDINNLLAGTYTVVVTDNNGCSEITTVTLNVESISPVFTSPSTTNFIENGESTVYTALAIDAGAIIYSLASTNDEAFFEIDASTGELTFKSVPDFENPQDADLNNSYVVIVKATDEAGNISTLELMVTVTDVDEDRPVFTSGETASFTENDEGTVYTAVATDEGTITYSLGTSVDEEYFNIDSSTGVITFLSAPDFENPLDGDANNSYVLIIKATDSEGNESTLELLISVIDLNEEPIISSSPITTINSSEEYVYTIEVSDPDDDPVELEMTQGPSWLKLQRAYTTVETFAGSGNATNLNGQGVNASFGSVGDIAIDNNDNVFVGVSAAHVLKKIDKEGNVTTYAGILGVGGSVDGSLQEATFGHFTAITFDKDGNLFVVDGSERKIRKISTEGLVTTVAGSGVDAVVNGSASEAAFSSPVDIAVDSHGNLFIAETNDHTIRKIDTDGNVSTFAGSGLSGFVNANGVDAYFNSPTSLVIDSEDNLYVTDISNFHIRKITPQGEVTSYVGKKAFGNVDAQGENAVFNSPYRLAIDSDDNLYVTELLDFFPPTIRKVDTEQNVTTIAGSTEGYLDGAALEAQFGRTLPLDIDSRGRIYIADEDNYRVRRVNSVITLTGNPEGQVGDYNISLSASDGNGAQAIQAFTLIVTDNESPAFTSASTASFTENNEGTVYTAIATDAGNITYSLGTSVDEEYFAIDSNTGVITFLSTPDFENPLDGDENNSYVLIVKATDNEGNESALELMVTVTDVDEDGPVFTSDETASFTENSGGTVYTAVATDAGTITYSLGTSVDEEYFAIDSNTGVITFLSTPDYETPLDGDENNSYVLVVKATDNEGNESTLELMVTVTDVDENRPVFTSDETARFTENAEGTVYTAVAIDAGTITYSLGTSVDEEYFAIDSNTGVITFLSTPDFETPLDGDENNSYVLIVKATDHEGNESTLELMVTVTDVDEDGPVFTSVTTASFDENASGTVYTAIVTDEGSITFSLGTSKDESAFTIDSGTGVLTFVSPPDFESPSSQTGSNNYLIDIKATDGSNNETTLTLTVTVDNVDEDAPVFTSPTEVSFTENSNDIVSQITVTDNSQITFTLYQSLDGSIFNLDQSGVLTFKDVPDYEVPRDKNQDNVYEILIEAKDEYQNTEWHRMYITLEDVEEKPEFITDPVVEISQESEIQYEYLAEIRNPSSDPTNIKADVLPDWLNADPVWQVSTLAGGKPYTLLNGEKTMAIFNYPKGMASDAEGNLYVADYNHHVIRKISTDGQVSTFAGTGLISFEDGDVDKAGFYFPIDLKFDNEGSLIVADEGNHAIRKISAQGKVTTIAGNGIEGYEDGMGKSSKFSKPRDLAIDSEGNIYINDVGNLRIRKIDTDGEVTTLAGSGEQEEVDGVGIEASFSSMIGLTVDSEDNLYLGHGSSIKKITSNGVVSTFVGSSTAGYLDDVGTTALLRSVWALTTGPDGYLYFADVFNFRIRKVSLQGEVMTVAGSGQFGTEDGSAFTADLGAIYGLVFDKSGNLYFTENADRIRRLTASGVVEYFAGNDRRPVDIANGYGTDAVFKTAKRSDVDSNGNLYVSDSESVRKITPSGYVSYLEYIPGSSLHDIFIDRSDNVFVSSEFGVKLLLSNTTNSNFVGSTLGFSDGAGRSAQFDGAFGLTMDSNGDLLVADTRNNRIRRVVLEGEGRYLAGTVSTYAGSVEGYKDGNISEALFNRPYALVSDNEDNVFIADSGNLRVRKISASGQVTTLAGNGEEGSIDGKGEEASFTSLQDITIDDEGNLWVIDNNLIRRIEQDGTVTTIGKNSEKKHRDGLVETAGFLKATGIEYHSGVFYIMDSEQATVRYMSPSGLLLSGNPANQAGQHNVSISATDVFGGANSQEFVINVTPGDVPIFTSVLSTSFTENSEGTVYTAQATDAGTITYSLAEANDEELFTINGSTGELTFKSAPDFESPQDADLNNTYVLVVKATDEVSNISTLELTVIVTDVDDDILEGSLSINDVTRAENADAGSTTDFIFTVTLSGNVGSAFTVDYGTGDNTATTAGSDYSATSGTLNFAGTAGETQQITVTVNTDDDLEADETFGVQLVNLQANGQSITIADDTGVGTITNDDQSTLSISDITKVEGNSGTTDFTFS
ncbi:MAG: hypothetical protein HWE07_02365, partial [Cytophagia bacterium]|nr:hypothetical protein [Cytophagia bacterium]